MQRSYYMKKYEQLTKFIDIFSNNNFGNWHIDRENDGTLEHPIQMPFVHYEPSVVDFIETVQAMAIEKGLTNYVDTLNQSGIEWDSDSMKRANVRTLTDDTILSLLIGAVRAEKFCDGALLNFLTSGSIQKWLFELKKRDEKMCIKLDDLLRISDSEAGNVKVKFNQTDGNEDPMELYLRDPKIINDHWLFWRNKQRYFRSYKNKENRASIYGAVYKNA